MVFRIDFSNTAGSELSRIISEQLGSAEADLEQARLSASTDAIHELRKTTKKLRALLRLLEGTLPRRELRHTIRNLRNISATLAGDRDATVMDQTLRRAYQELLPDSELSARPWRELSLSEGVLDRAAAGPDEASWQAMRSTLHQLSESALGAPNQAIDYSDLLRGLAKSYRRGRRLLRRVERRISQDPTGAALTGAPGTISTALPDACIEALHDLRKRVKDQLYQLRLMVHLAPSQLRGDALEFDQLAALLGEHHDLATLRSALDRARATYRSTVELPGLYDWVLKAMARLEDEALGLARELYAESPKARRRRMNLLLTGVTLHKPEPPAACESLLPRRP